MTNAPTRVLIAEDEALIRLDLKEMLEEEGYVVVAEVGDGQAAVEQAQLLRPDLVVHLSGGRSIVVDSKVPLDAFLDATSADDDAARSGHLARHARQLRTHVDQLSSKQYWKAAETPEFVVLFLPKALGATRSAVERVPVESEEVSRTLGERELFPKIRAAGPDPLVVADGFSCRTQIREGTDASGRTLAEVMRSALPEAR